MQLLNSCHPVPCTCAKGRFDNGAAPFSIGGVFCDGYLLLPMIGRTRFLKEVCYGEDLAEAYKQHIKYDGDNIFIYGYPAELARYKWNRWEFQREHRFVLTALRGPRSTDNPHEYGARYYDLVRDQIGRAHV